MSKHTENLTSDTSIKICSAGRGTHMDAYVVTVFADGNFGGGTVTIQASPDSGSTLVTLKDQGGTTVSITADDVYAIGPLGYAGRNGEEIEIYATMSGSTTPDVNITAFDNR